MERNMNHALYEWRRSHYKKDVLSVSDTSYSEIFFSEFPQQRSVVKHQTSVWKVMDSTPVGRTQNFFLSSLCHWLIKHLSHISTKLIIHHNLFIHKPLQVWLSSTILLSVHQCNEANKREKNISVNNFFFHICILGISK